MRREEYVVVPSAQLFRNRPHLGDVPVLIPHGIGAEVFRDLCEQQIGTSGIAGTGNATGSRYIYGSPWHYPAFPEQWRDREQNGSRVAPRVRHDLRPRNFRAHQLSKAIWCFGIGCRARPRSEIGGEIYHPRSGRACISHPLGRCPVRKRCEDNLRLVQGRILCRDISHLSRSNAGALPPLLVGRREGEVKPGVPRDQSAQLPPCVSARAEDSNRNFMHKECITLHYLRVNDPAARSRNAFRGAKLTFVANKRERHDTILEIVDSRVVSSQEDLRKMLLQRGWDVTQATLSRDLRELRLARVPTPEGARYAITDGSIEESRVALDTLLPQLFLRIDGVGEMLVLRTVPGGAQPIAAALDGEGWSDVLGTVGGDDTILIICRSVAARERVLRRLKALAGEPG
jgi:transcriptional regulator of arginine metabolism